MCKRPCDGLIVGRYFIESGGKKKIRIQSGVVSMVGSYSETRKIFKQLEYVGDISIGLVFQLEI